MTPFPHFADSLSAAQGLAEPVNQGLGNEIINHYHFGRSRTLEQRPPWAVLTGHSNLELRVEGVGQERNRQLAVRVLSRHHQCSRCVDPCPVEDILVYSCIPLDDEIAKIG